MKFIQSLIILLLCSQSFAARAVPVIQMTYPDHPVSELFIPIVQQSYRDIGYEVNLVSAPLSRRMQMLNQGMVDADLGARSTAESTYSSILKVEPRLLSGEIRLFCRPGKFCHETVLKEPALVIYTDSSGWDVLDEIFGSRLKVTRGVVQRYSDVIDMYNKQRTDYIIVVKMENNIQLAVPESTASIKLADVEYYHFIHVKHQALAPALSKALKKNLKPSVGKP